jgi:hypothetical protein
MPAKGWGNKSLYTLFLGMIFSFIAFFYVYFTQAENRAMETHQRLGMSHSSAVPDKFTDKAWPGPTVSLTAKEWAWLKEHPNIVLAYTDAFEPEIIVNPDGSYRGIQVDILDDLNRRLGILKVPLERGLK